MHPAILFTARYGPLIAPWLFEHQDQIAQSFHRFSTPIFDSLAGRSQSVDRIGATLVAQQQDGHQEVIGLLHRQGSQLDGIDRAVNGIAEAVAGVTSTQSTLVDSLGLLTSLSAVTLGFSVLTPVILLAQFGVLHNRLKVLKNEIKERFDIKEESNLSAGLTHLRNAHESHANAGVQSASLNAANDQLTSSQEYYSLFLLNECGKGVKANEEFTWVLSRHHTVAILGLTACHLRQQSPALALGTLEKGIHAMRKHASEVFKRTIGAGSSPMRYLMPAMKKHGVTLESMAELYRQAGHAGVLENTQKQSTTEFFEAQRDYLAPAKDPLIRKSAAVQKLRNELTKVTAAIEEVNRVKGLALALRHCMTHGLDYLTLEQEIITTLNEKSPVDGSCFAFFPAPNAA